MRRGTVIGVTLLGIGVAVLIAVGAYHAGSHYALVQTTTAGGQVVRVAAPGYYGHWAWGFFPGFLLFPLLIFGFFFLMRGLFWGRRWGGPGGAGRVRLAGAGAGCSRTGTAASTNRRPATTPRPEANPPQRPRATTGGAGAGVAPAPPVVHP